MKHEARYGACALEDNPGLYVVIEEAWNHRFMGTWHLKLIESSHTRRKKHQDVEPTANLFLYATEFWPMECEWM